MFKTFEAGNYGGCVLKFWTLFDKIVKVLDAISWPLLHDDSATS